MDFLKIKVNKLKTFKSYDFPFFKITIERQIKDPISNLFCYIPLGFCQINCQRNQRRNPWSSCSNQRRKFEDFTKCLGGGYGSQNGPKRCG